MNVASVLSPESPQAHEILSLFWILLAVASFIVAVVAGFVVASILRFRRRSGDGMPRQDPGDRRLEIAWTIVPLLIVSGLFLLAVRTMHQVQPPAGDREADLKVIAHQWWWEGHYPKTGVTVANEFHFPVGQTLLLRFHSDDVVHDWWVPELGRKMDIFPNHPTHLWMKIDRPGTYLGTCDEFCGAEHAWMRIRVIAQTPEEYEEWTRAQLGPPNPPSGAEASEGLAAYATHTCATCHTIAGISSGTIGPDLTHVGSRKTLGAGVLENTPGNMARWIHDAQTIKPGCEMPSMGMSEKQARQIAAYMEELK